MWKKGLYCVVATTLLLAACGSEDEATEQSDPPKQEETVQQEESKVEEVQLPYITPFTGERVENEITMRPIIVTINNHPQARPQAGLASADVVYEMLAEGDVTRFLALFQSDIPENIGPVRSARDYFIDIAVGLDAFYIAHGYSPEAHTMLFSGVIDNVNGMQYDGTLFHRSKDRKAPHNSYISGDNVKIAAEKVGASLLYQKKVSYTYYESDEDVNIGLQTNNIEVNYSKNGQFNSVYSYNSVDKTYSRQSGNDETVDDLTNQPIAISNILIFEMDHKIIDSVGRREIDITKGGNAYVFQNGTMREVLWENRDGVLKAVEGNGSEVKLVPGKTWVHFVPSYPGIESFVTYTQ
ncbi:DUF3048 domain-containing protein [Ureibacillus manganicus]|uniref:Lipoprotein YerB n=1 Tax=Ureibacillus manganicus DSM 26584 TaxID=1384049 RepID=A0A0A3I2T3_9BACL|nr:DUF3048 domain-containing protein [Ureibacillus manganicus]KGR79136.1 hypothetical protein CD29_07215 [Ureibacillus manganicus DSM 26584]